MKKFKRRAATGHILSISQILFYTYQICTSFQRVRSFLQIFFYKFLFSPCNPPIIGFLSQEVRRKGEQPFYIIYYNFLLNQLGSFFSTTKLLYSFQESNTQSFCSALPTHFDCIFLTSQTNSEDVFPKDEWLGFLFLGVKEAG